MVPEINSMDKSTLAEFDIDSNMTRRREVNILKLDEKNISLLDISPLLEIRVQRKMVVGMVT
jgi:hypothetical protein